MTPVTLFLLVGILFCIVMALAWAMQRRTGKFGWADIFWTYGLGLTGAAAALLPLPHDMNPARQWLVAAMVAAWSLRLGTHILTRLRHGDDDPRYVALDKQWGKDAPRKMFLFLQLQALGGLPLLLAVMLAARAPGGGIGWQDLAGFALLLGAVIGEGVADAQLRRFARDPANKGKVCDTGLWRWSRHPNYFFEWLGWLSYAVIALRLDGSYPWAWLAFLAPAAMYHFLVNVSGIPPLEAHMLRSRGEAFRAYQQRTSAFFPWPPGSQRSSR